MNEINQFGIFLKGIFLKIPHTNLQIYNNVCLPEGVMALKHWDNKNFKELRKP